MKIVNGEVFCDDFKIRKAPVYCDQTITSVDPGGSVLDASGCIVSPGFIDIHIHGANGFDFYDGTPAALQGMADYLAGVGVTGFLGTSIACPRELLAAQYANAGEYIKTSRGGAVMFGINMEGPFFALQKKAAFDPRFLDERPDFDFFIKLYELSGGNIRIADVAPELEGALDYIKRVSAFSRVSLGHTAAVYEQAVAGFEAGATNVTHLFNAMSPLSHREPGMVGAAFDRCEFAELISDGIHIAQSVVRAAFTAFGDDRICLVSDAMRACGIGNGVYTLGGLRVSVLDGKATLDSGTIAGSATPLSECMRRAVTFGVKLESALRAATANPAKAAGIFSLTGSITVGKRADFTILDRETLEVKHTVIGGELVF